MSDDDDSLDAAYQELMLEPLRRCADYLPKMGGNSEVDLHEFRGLYSADPFYHWLGLDSALMFAAHKAAGGMTSVYRQLGVGCERLFRQIIRDELALTEDQARWEYQIPSASRSGPRPSKPRTLSLDGRIDLRDIGNRTAAERVRRWVENQRSMLGIEVPLVGAVFEVRQGYKSADSKRQNADLTNAAQAISHGYLPVLAVLSTQINHAVHARYLSGNWLVLMGFVGKDDPNESTFDFLRDIIGFDLARFFERRSRSFRTEVTAILTKLLEPR